MHTFKSKYTLGDIVYLVTDIEQLERIITDVQFSGNGNVLYFVNCGPENSKHYEFELSSRKNICLNLGIDKTENKL